MLLGVAGFPASRDPEASVKRALKELFLSKPIMIWATYVRTSYLFLIKIQYWDPVYSMYK